MEHTTPLKQINPNAEPLTIESVKKVDGYQIVSDEQAQEVISAIDILSRAVYAYAVQQTTHENNNPKSIAA